MEPFVIPSSIAETDGTERIVYKARFVPDNTASMLSLREKQFDKIIAPSEIRDILMDLVIKGSRYFNLIKFKPEQVYCPKFYTVETDMGFYAHASGVLVEV